MRTLLLFSLLCLSTAHAEVTVYALSDMLITGKSEYTRIDLDEPDKLLAELGEDLPADLDAAADEMRGRMSDDRNVPLINGIEDAFKGLLRAFSEGIEQLPRDCLDDELLLYGVSDVDQALAIAKEESDLVVPETAPVDDTDLWTETVESEDTTEVTESVVSGDTETIDTGAIFAASVNLNCMDWR